MSMTATDKMMPSPVPMMAAVHDKQIRETHADDKSAIEVEMLLDLVRDIFYRANLCDDPGDFWKNLQEINYQDIVTPPWGELPDISRFSVELSRKVLSQGNTQETTIYLLQILARYSWYDKPVLALAAFAFNCGNFELLNQVYSSNQLANSIAILKQQPLTTGESAAQEHVPKAVYWIIKFIVSCASFNHKYLTRRTGALDLPTLDHEMADQESHLEKQIDKCVQSCTDENHRLTEAIHIDDSSMKSLIDTEGLLPPFMEGTRKKKVEREVLRGKNVWLLISRLDISQHELSTLKQIHIECQPKIPRHEMVWIPMVETSAELTAETKKQFEDRQSKMQCYTVVRLGQISQRAIQVFKEMLHFRDKPILLVLDPQGKVLCRNAIHMMWIWGSRAFPFTTQVEEDLWKEQTWGLELLVTGIDEKILNWNEEGKYVFLYGGRGSNNDIKWIRNFTAVARQVSQAANIPLEMAYVGNSGKWEQVQRMTGIIDKEGLSYTWKDPTKVWRFWTRLESMLFSKIQLGKTDGHDLVMQQTKRLLSFDKAEGWAMLSRRSSIIMNGHGATILRALQKYDLWKDNAVTKGYDAAFKAHHDTIEGSTHLCCRLEFRSMAGMMPKSVRCPNCPSLMEELITFDCCHDEEAPGAPK